MNAIRTRTIVEIEIPAVERVTGDAALPVWRGMLHAVVGEGESGKTWLAVHTALAVVRSRRQVLILDGEMSGHTWRRRLHAVGGNEDEDNLDYIHYAEMAADAVDVGAVIETCNQLRHGNSQPPVALIVWDSALSLISRTARSENDNAEVSRVYDRIREIVRRTDAAGLIVDHTTRGSSSLVSRGATAKFNALDVSYGVRLSDGSVPSQDNTWSSIVSVEKDRHGLLPGRVDREATFIPLGRGALQLEIAECSLSTHRLAAANPTNRIIERIAQLDPPPTSANEAHKRVGGTRTVVLAAFKQWSAQGGSGGSSYYVANHRTTSTEPVRTTEPPSTGPILVPIRGDAS